MAALFFAETLFVDAHDSAQVKSAFAVFTSLATKLHEDHLDGSVPAEPYLMLVGSEHQLWQVLYEMNGAYQVSIEEATNVSRIIDRCKTHRAEVDGDLHVVTRDGG